MIEPRVLKGFRDMLPAQELRRREVQSRLEEVYRAYGFVPIDTPVLEYTDVLLGKGGGETDKQVYRFRDHGDRDVAMRFDLTVPFARYMAGHLSELYLPFKRYHMAKVFRGENTQRGRYREFTQCDFDIVGVDSSAADVEVISLILDSFRALGVPEVTIRVAHRGVFSRFLHRLGVAEQTTEVLRTVDKMGKVGPERTRRDVGELVGERAAEEVLAFTTSEGDNRATLEKLQLLSGADGSSDDPARRLEAVLGSLEEAGIGEAVTLDPSITRGLDYYTGIVFETFLDALPEIGSVCSGGRYNDLASLYTKQQLPGVGASVGLDRLMAALEELGQGEQAGGIAADALVFCMEEGLVGYYHAIARALRENGLRADVFPSVKKLARQFSFAEKKGIPFAVICGEDERASGVVNVKDLRHRESAELPTVAAAAEWIRARL